MKKKIYFFPLLLVMFNSTYSQNVGISDDAAFTSPQSPLHIYWTSDGNLLQLSRSSAANTGLIFSVTTDNFSINNRQAGSLSLWTNNTERLRIPNAAQILSVSDGTAALPAWSFVNNTTMGIYRSGINQMSISTNSAERMRINSDGTILLNNYVSGANGAILRTNNTGLVSITNFTGVANDVLLGNGNFGNMNTLAWQLSGNSATNPSTNFIGTTDAQDLVLRSNNTERMRILSSGAVRIGYGTAATDALQVGGYGTSNPTVFVGSEGTAPGYGRIGLYGTTYGTFSTILRGGGLSYFNSGNQYVFGQTTAVDANDFVGIVGNATYPWALNAYTNVNSVGAIYGQASGTGSYGVWGENSAVDGIGIIGNNSSTTANINARGVQGQTANPAGSGVVGINTSTTANANAAGVYGQTANPAGTGVAGINASTTANINATGVFGYTTNSSGSAVYANLNNTTADDNASGVYSQTNNPAGDAGLFVNSATAGTNNGNGIIAISSQSGGAGVFARNQHSNGIGVIGLGGNYPSFYAIIGGAGVEGVNNTASGVGSYFRNDVANTNSSFAAAVYAVSNATYTTNIQAAIYADCGVDDVANRLGVFCRGRFTATGTKSSLFKANDGTTRLLYCTESPEVWYEDIGSGQLVNGFAKIELDDLFIQATTINDKHPMHVFIQLEGECNGGVYVVKGTTSFTVHQQGGNNSNASFSYRILAKRKGNEDERFGILAPIKEPEVTIQENRIKIKEIKPIDFEVKPVNKTKNN